MENAFILPVNKKKKDMPLNIVLRIFKSMNKNSYHNVIKYYFTLAWKAENKITYALKIRKYARKK